MNFQSALARPLDFDYPTNRAVAILTLVAMVIGLVIALMGGEEFMPALGSGVAAGFTFFWAWAMAREIDPDYQLSAFLAAILAYVGVLLLGIPDLSLLLGLFLLMQLVRIVNRIVGPSVTSAESFVVLAFVAAMSLLVNWLYALVGVVAFALDSRLPQPNKRHIWSAVLSGLVGVIAFLYTDGFANVGVLSLPYIIGMVVAGALFVIVILRSGTIESACDVARYTVYARRVQAGQALALIAGLNFAMWMGDASVVSLLPLWATMLGVGLYRLIAPFMPEIDLSPKGQPTREPSTN